MKHLTLLLPLLSLPLLRSPGGDAPRSCCAPPAVARTAADLETIKALAGSWVALDEKGAPGAAVTAEYRVTAGGSAVIETLFPGQEHEMISLYYLEGGALMLTHYCVLGNHPRMKAHREKETGTLVFACIGGENFASCAEADHMHEGRVTFDGPDRMRSRWTELAGGKPGEAVEFTLVRRRE